MIQSKLTKVFEDNNGILTTKMANENGINDSTLRKAVERKDIKNIAGGLFTGRYLF
ncbi:MAG TPA: hypothetical protein VK105_14725 [Virgibacillus sp.]|nr:hypothetical protein [Virgibacillus sp.]HLR68358.1 hypothetical protein [Virgibacillus sp.]